MPRQIHYYKRKSKQKIQSHWQHKCICVSGCIYVYTREAGGKTRLLKALTTLPEG